MKTKQLFVAIMLLFTATFTACEKDKDELISKPVISNLEVGASNSKIGYVGADLHLEADVEAAGKIKTIEVEIHKESGSGWEFKKVYEEFSGSLNANFHKHVDIPADVQIGDYHLHLKVIDMEGNETQVESELEIQVNADTEAPIINVTAAPAANQQYTSGQSIAISGTITVNVAVGGYVAMLVRSDDTQVTNSTIITMDWKAFQDQTQVSFSATIKAGAQYDNQPTPALIQIANAWRTGDYYILLRSWDSSGKTTDSQKYPIKITL